MAPVLARGRIWDAAREVAYWSAVALLFAAIGAAGGRLVSRDPSEQASPPGPLVVGRDPVDPSADPADEARRIARSFAQGTVTLRAEGFETRATRERLGLSADQDEIARLVRAWRDPSSDLRRFREAAGLRGPAAVPVPVRLDQTVATAFLLAIKDELDQPAEDAHINLARRERVADRAGRRLDLYETLRRLVRASRAARDEIELAAIVVQPHTKAADLARVDFSGVLGWFETPYARIEETRDRTYNLGLAASKLAGQIIVPGGVFSFNEAVGERSEANGYRVAPVIAQGELVDGMGGGTCQIAGTLHAAAFFAGLEIVDRQPHSRPSSYIRMGLDATVSYPNIDLKLRNPFDFPVVVNMTVEGGKVRAEILGPRRDRVVTYVRQILETQDFPQRTVEDETMPRGTKVITQNGVPGFKIRRMRITSEGDTMWREDWLDTYPPTVQVVRVGVNGSLRPGDVELPRPDSHGPFPPACHMRSEQGPDGRMTEQTACR